MPVVSAPQEPTHKLAHAQFTSLATPSRGGTVDTSVFRVELLPGAPATPHRLTREEVFIVLEGHGRVTLGQEHRCVQAGDVIVVPAHTDFELTCEGEQRLTALCCLPVGGMAQLPDGAPFPPPWSL